MASSFQKSMFLVLLLSNLFLFFSTTLALNSSSSSTTTTTTTPSTLNSTNFPLAKSICKSTPYPDLCFDSLKLSVSININPNILTFVLQILQNAISEAGKLSDLFLHLGNSGIIEQQTGTIQDCKDLHQITISSLQKTVTRIQSTPDKRKLSDAKTFLSAALTNKMTCLEGLDTANGPLKPALVNSITTTYQHVSNSLSALSHPNGKSKATSGNNKNCRRLLGFPAWLSRRNRRILQDDNEYDSSEVITVAKDGSGNFTTVSDAIKFAPSNSYDRIIIYVKEGIYKENVEISKHKTNIVLLGDGSDVTVITGKRSVAGSGWTTFRSATVAVSGEGFLARDITFENTAGPANHQAVALRINADLTAVYRCNIKGYQDTLYVHSFRQFYRECNIFGTVDFIFGNAAVVFQGCNIIARLPNAGQFNAITAQSRTSPDENTGISIQNCSILASEDLLESNRRVKSFLGRPWKEYARTVYMESYIDGLIDPLGWKEWSNDSALDTLYYGEYDNSGPGSVTNNRVTWQGYNVMDYDDALDFTVSELITGDEWLDSTSFPYQDGI